MSMIAEIVTPPRRHGSTVCAETVYVETVIGTFCSFPLSQGLRTGRRMDIVPDDGGNFIIGLRSRQSTIPVIRPLRHGHTDAVHMAACIHD